MRNDIVPLPKRILKLILGVALLLALAGAVYTTQAKPLFSGEPDGRTGLQVSYQATYELIPLPSKDPELNETLANLRADWQRLTQGESDLMITPLDSR